MSDFAKISELVTQGQQLLDSIKGGAIRTMQTQFDALKKTFNDKLASVSGDLDSFVIQQKNSVNSIFSDPDSRYQRATALTVNVGGDIDKFYPVFIRSNANRISTLNIGRSIHMDGTWKGAMLASFELVESGWSSRPGLMVLNRLKMSVHVSTPDLSLLNQDGFIAGYGLSSTLPAGGIVWLRGGLSYQVHSDGSPIRTVKEYTAVTDKQEADICICLGGYVNGSRVYDVKTSRDAVLIPEFKNYERA